MKDTRLPSSFYLHPTLEVAHNLLGKVLVTQHDSIRTSGYIVETEAYIGSIDEAAHSYRGRTLRTDVMFQEGGYCYVYLIYGMHECVNVVTEQAGLGTAVLIRALEPKEGIKTMRLRRGKSPHSLLTQGPARLCKAMGITRTLKGEYYPTSSHIWIESGKDIPLDEIGVSARIGITKSKDLPWRFFVRNNPWVSGPKTLSSHSSEKFDKKTL